MSFRTACIGGVLLAVLAPILCGQGLEDRPVGIFLGYNVADTFNPNTNLTYTEFSSTPVITYGRMHQQGLDFGVYVRQNRWLRWRADVSGNGGILSAGDDYELGGPEFTFHAGRAIFFAHALFGRGSVGGGLFGVSRDGFAMAFGGGVDLRVTSWFGIRLIDADYLPSHFSGPAYNPVVNLFGPELPPPPQVTTWENNTRLTFGVVFKVGPKS
jgi:hypothetical protein